MGTATHTFRFVSAVLPLSIRYGSRIHHERIAYKNVNAHNPFHLPCANWMTPGRTARMIMSTAPIIIRRSSLATDLENSQFGESPSCWLRVSNYLYRPISRSSHPYRRQLSTFSKFWEWRRPLASDSSEGMKMA